MKISEISEKNPKKFEKKIEQILKKKFSEVFKNQWNFIKIIVTKIKKKQKCSVKFPKISFKQKIKKSSKKLKFIKNFKLFKIS